VTDDQPHARDRMVLIRELRQLVEALDRRPAATLVTSRYMVSGSLSRASSAHASSC
jgi:hypothetical protein